MKFKNEKRVINVRAIKANMNTVKYSRVHHMLEHKAKNLQTDPEAAVH